MNDHTRVRTAAVALLLAAGALCTGCDHHRNVSMEMRIVEKTAADSLVRMTMKVWGGEETFYAHDEVLLTERDVSSAAVVRRNGMPAIELTLDEVARRKLLDVSRRNLGRTLGIVIDGRLQSVSLMETPIENGVVMVTGHMLEHGARRFCSALERQRA